MSLQGPETKKLFDRAMGAMVNGVSSGWRYWGRDETIVLSRGEGSHVYDADGVRYIDYHMGFGPVILGHADPQVTEAVAKAAADGITFAFTQEREVLAAEKVKEAVPWVERLRFTNTGTEATMHAARLARGFTGRDVLLKFEGQYHGAHDYVMYSAPGMDTEMMGSRYRPIPIPMSSGMPGAINDLILTLPYNDLEAVRRTFRNEGHRIAAILVEPMMGNSMGIMPVDGFLEGLRDVCDEYGTVLIFDEVKTGFRIATGGAAEVFGVVPDLAAFAKALGNGVPVAAIAGRGEVLEGWAKGGITQAGTYSGNAISTAAATATVTQLMTGKPMERINKIGGALMDGVRGIMAEAGVPGAVMGHPSMFGVYFGEEPPTDLRGTASHNEDLYEATMMGMIRRGVLPSPDAHEPWFLSAAHDEEDVAQTLEAFGDALDEALG